jgi:hypothetical protein
MDKLMRTQGVGSWFALMFVGAFLGCGAGSSNPNRSIVASENLELYETAKAQAAAAEQEAREAEARALGDAMEGLEPR